MSNKVNIQDLITEAENAIVVAACNAAHQYLKLLEFRATEDMETESIVSHIRDVVDVAPHA